jgi:hypothetical protein
MVVDPSEAKPLESDDDAPDTWRGRAKRWLHRLLPVKY